MRTPISIMLAVSDIGGKLGIAEDGILRMLLPVDCPSELKDAIRQHKAALLTLLAGPDFLIVRSELLPTEPLFWTANEQGRDMLIEHGAHPGQVYTSDELRMLVSRNTDPDTLTKLHRAKRLFSGRLTSGEGL